MKIPHPSFAKEGLQESAEIQPFNEQNLTNHSCEKSDAIGALVRWVLWETFTSS